MLQMLNSDSFVHWIRVQHCAAGIKILWKFNGRSIVKVLLKLYKGFKAKTWQCSRFVLHAKGRSFGVFKLYSMEVLKLMEELDHEEGNLDHKCKVIVDNS